MERPIIQITEPREIKSTFGSEFPNGIVTHYDYSVSHLIYKGEDLGTMEDIKTNLHTLKDANYIIKFQDRLIEKLVNKDKLNKLDKKYLSHFKRRKHEWRNICNNK